MRVWMQAFIGAALGKLFINLLLAALVVLGFGGPNEWVAAVMPFVIAPSVIRLGLLLIASVGIFMEWCGPVWRVTEIERPKDRWIYRASFVTIASLPFVIGSFYLTAKPRAEVPISITIPAGQSLSNSVALPTRIVGLTMSPEWDDAGLEFLVSRDNGQTYQPMYDYNGIRISLPVAANRYIILTPDVWAGVTNLRIESVDRTNEKPIVQSAKRTIYLATQF